MYTLTLKVYIVVCCLIDCWQAQFTHPAILAATHIMRVLISLSKQLLQASAAVYMYTAPVYLSSSTCACGSGYYTEFPTLCNG